MPLQLRNAWSLDSGTCIHVGFAAHKTIGEFNKPMEQVGKIHVSAEAAVAAAERLGEGYAAFRVYKYKKKTEPKELIRREDLPVSVTNE